MLKKTITDFKRYLAGTGLKQYEAAEILGVEKGHLNRILTGKRNLTPQMAVEMRRLMGEKDIMSLEECMIKYPMGSFIINSDYLFPDEYECYLDKKDCVEFYKENQDVYSMIKSDGGFSFKLFYQDSITKKYQILTLWGDSITTYSTEDGISFSPICKIKEGLHYWHYLSFEEASRYSIINELLLKDFSNLNLILDNVFKQINQNYNSNYIYYSTYENFLRGE